MQQADLGDIRLHYRIDGEADGAPLVLLHGLGTDLRLWDPLLPHLPRGLRILRFDGRGHGLSSCPKGPYAMGTLVRDAERLMERLGFQDSAVLGLSLGGMVAQALAVKRLDLVRVLILANTGCKLGTKAIWDARAAELRQAGLGALAETALERWFTAEFRRRPEAELWRNLLLSQPREGYAACAEAIGGTDLMTPTSGLRLPLLALAADADPATPPDLVRETADLVPGSRFHLIRRAAHLSCVERPAAFAEALAGFLSETGHLQGRPRPATGGRA